MTTTAEPGERRPTLERPPGERYATERPGGDEPPSRAATLGRAVAVAVGGALAIGVLGGLLLLTVGLIVVGAVLGWLLGRLSPSRSTAILLSVGSAVLGLLAIWAIGRLEGGVMDPLAYLLEVHGPLAVILPLVTGLVAAATAE